MKLLRPTGRDQLSQGSGHIGVNNSVHLDSRLREVFNVTFTDYCSLRTKRKLDFLITKPQYRLSTHKAGNFTKSNSREDCLKILSMKGNNSTKGTFFQRQNKTRGLTRGIVSIESKASRDWLSKKIMELQMLESKWGEANGRKMTLERHQKKIKNASKRYHFRSLTAETDKRRPESSHLQGIQRQKTAFERISHPQRGLVSLSQPQVINGWENDSKDLY